MAKTVLGDNLVVEKAPLTITNDGKEEISEVPFAYTPNLIKKIADMVGEYER